MDTKRTPQQGAEAARKAGQEIADLVYEKQLAYGDASGIQHAIWKALLAQWLAPPNVSWWAGDPQEEVVRFNLGGQYVIPVELMDHIPRLTRVFDRICRIVSNPAMDRMGEDPWRDLAGDALCGIVMPRTGPSEAQLAHMGADNPRVTLTLSMPDGDYEFQGTIRPVGSNITLGAEDFFEVLGDGVVYGERGTDRVKRKHCGDTGDGTGPTRYCVLDKGHTGDHYGQGISWSYEVADGIAATRTATPAERTDFGETLAAARRNGWGDDPNEPAEPAPAETRYWAEDLVGAVPGAEKPQHLRNTTHGDEAAQAEEMRKRSAATVEANEQLAAHLQQQRERREVSVPPMRIARDTPPIVALDGQ